MVLRWQAVLSLVVLENLLCCLAAAEWNKFIMLNVWTSFHIRTHIIYECKRKLCSSIQFILSPSSSIIIILILLPECCQNTIQNIYSQFLLFDVGSGGKKENEWGFDFCVFDIIYKKFILFDVIIFYFIYLFFINTNSYMS